MRAKMFLLQSVTVLGVLAALAGCASDVTTPTTTTPTTTPTPTTPTPTPTPQAPEKPVRAGVRETRTAATIGIPTRVLSMNMQTPPS
ncbi:hypothetical protein BH09GEM1_BH09GEM1_40860 [soil metagenome]